jgi:hypothetical protein
VPDNRTPFFVLVTGSRDWPEEAKHLIWERLDRLPREAIIVHGDADGVDRYTDVWATDPLLGNRPAAVDRFPADWTRYGHAAGPIRNQQMLEHIQKNFVDIDPDNLILAFFRSVRDSVGTRDMVRRGLGDGVPVVAYELFFNEEEIWELAPLSDSLLAQL